MSVREHAPDFPEKVIFTPHYLKADPRTRQHDQIWADGGVILEKSTDHGDHGPGWCVSG